MHVGADIDRCRHEHRRLENRGRRWLTAVCVARSKNDDQWNAGFVEPRTPLAGTIRLQDTEGGGGGPVQT